MTSNEIRTSFLEFFKSKGHTIVPSGSLIPANDQTLLFTNAGMNQFKDVFLGTGTRSYKRATDTQKCIRVSGKHNDLDEVGHDTYHHTFFEMLGNWSLGDYYKREAIEFAWELLTEIWGLPKDRLWATVFRDDDEAEKLWYEVTDITKEHVLRFDEKDNFWEMGETGPCGPCSEIHFDLGEEGCDKIGVAHLCQVNGNCRRFIELWNLVFIQYNRNETGALEGLPATHIDTGMGFERIVAVLQDRFSNYEIDLFMPIIKVIADMTGHQYFSDERGIPHRVISDHMRCLTFAISDGVMPSNAGRGYVIRRILRRAVLYGKKLDMDEPFIHRLVNTVADIMGGAFPDILPRKEFVAKTILSEEERFHKTLDRGLDILDETLSQLKAESAAVVPGQKAFELYDTYGFPLDLTQIIAGESGFTVDEDDYQQAMDEQRERSRKILHTTGDEVYAHAYKEYGATEFLGHTTMTAEAEVLAIIKDNESVSSAQEGDEVFVILDRTPFYGEAGGQIGDTGKICNNEVSLDVMDTIKPIPDLTAHRCKIVAGILSPQTAVKTQVDAKRHQAIAISHTATHILHSALREVLGQHVAQSGSLVEPGRLRFDFTHNEALSQEQLREVERTVNERVRNSVPILNQRMSLQDALNKGAIAFFGDKYGDEVFVVQVGDFSIELCGGTHLESTGEIGAVKILSESSIAANTRRIEALTGEAAYQHQRESEDVLSELSALLKMQRNELVSRVQKLLEENRELGRHVNQLKEKLAHSEIIALTEDAQTVDGVKVVASALESVDRRGLRSLVDDAKNRQGSCVVVLGSVYEGKLAFIAGVTSDLVENRGLRAGDIIKDVAKIAGGGGGGRNDMAEAGGREPEKLNDAIDAVTEIIGKHLLT